MSKRAIPAHVRQTIQQRVYGDEPTGVYREIQQTLLRSLYTFNIGGSYEETQWRKRYYVTLYVDLGTGRTLDITINASKAIGEELPGIRNEATVNFPALGAIDPDKAIQFAAAIEAAAHLARDYAQELGITR